MGEEPQPSHTFDALVTHVIDTDKFWVQPLYNKEDRKKLAVIESALAGSAKPLSKVAKADDYVSVKLNERGWKRARLKQDIHHSLAYIQLIDYGSDEQVPESAIFSLPYELGIDVLQEQSMMCALGGVKPFPTRPPHSNQYFREILMNRKVTVKAYSISPNTSDLLVDVCTPELPSVRQHILLHQLGTPAIIPTAPYTKDPGTIQPKLGDRNAVIVSHISDLTDFFVQYRATEKNISSMMTAMKSMYTANVHSPANMINIGMLCCVQLGSDWFRAEIKQVLSTGYILVILKDFGNVQLVTAKQIYPLEGSLITTPFWAVRCGLNNIAPTTPTAIGNFPRQLIQWFHKYATDSNAYHIAHFIRHADDRFYIELHDEQGGGEGKPTTTELLITNKCAKRVTDNFPPYTGMQAQLNQMGSDMMSNLSQTNPQQFTSMVNSGVMNGSSGGLNGHAGGMTSHAGGMTSHVGGMASHAGGMTSHAGGMTSHAGGMTSHAGGMAPHAGSMTSQATAPAGYGASGYGSTMASMAANPGFLSTAANYMSTMTQQQQQFTQAAQTQQPSGISQFPAAQTQQYTTPVPAAQTQQYATPVPAAQQPAPAGRAPRSRGESKAPGDVYEGMYSEPDLGKMEEVAVEITTDPQNFICLLRKYFNDVDAANDDLKVAYTSGKDYSIPSARSKQGMACVAPYIEGGVTQYYRAKILKISRNDAEVFFVDYGNIQHVDLAELKYLPKACAKVPESYIRCEFDSVVPVEGNTWSQGSIRAFEDYLQGEFLCHIKGKNRNGIGYRVELYPVEGDNPLDNPVSLELERRGVLRRVAENISSVSSRGRRGHGPRSVQEPDMSRRDETRRDETRRDETRRDDTRRDDTRRDESERMQRSRGRDIERTQSARSASPTSSAANTELVRAGFRPPLISMKGYKDVRVYQPCTPSKFSCQLLSDKEGLDKLARKMHHVYDRSEEGDFVEDALPFTACAVLVEDSWQRGYILSISYHGCQLVLVDTQEIVSVDQDQLRTLRDEFIKLPAQGVKCALDGIVCKSNKWNSEACRYFKELVSDTEFIAEFRSERGGSYKLMLHSNVGGVDQLVNAMFVVRGWASSTDSVIRAAVEDLAAAKSSPFQMYSVKPGASHTVTPCHVVGPDEFYVHLAELQDPIVELAAKINEYYNSNPTEKAKLNVDSYCAAMWEEEWFRARIVSVKRDTCEVYFLDYGNTDTVPNTEIKGLAKQFKQEPMYAIRCMCEGIDPTTMSTMAPIFIELVEGDEDVIFHATFIKQEKGDGGYLVSLYDGKMPLVQKMYKILYSGGGGAATSSRSSRASRDSTPAHPCVELPKKDLVQISHARDPAMLYLHCERDGETENTILAIGEMLSEIYSRSQPPLKFRQAGSLCAIQYSEDEQWYRGEVKAVHGDQVQVQFLDYGNEETKRGSEVFELDKQLRDIPAQTTPCQLAGILEPPSGWADASRELNICESMKFSLTVVDPQANPPAVELFHATTGGSLAVELISVGYGIYPAGQCIAMPQVPSIEGGSFQAKVCYADYPGNVYIQKLPDAEKLEDLMKGLETDYKIGQSLTKLRAEPKIGTVCCAQYTDDGMYYRATIYGITRSSIKIQFTDFGNCEDKNASELYQLKDEYLGLPAQAIECSMHGCAINSTAWTRDMQDFFEEVVDQKAYNCQIMGKDSDHYQITLHDMATGNSLSDDINRYISSGGASAQRTQPTTTSSFGQGNSFGGVQSEPAAAAPAPVPPKTDEVVKIDWPPRIDKYEHVPAMISYGDGPEEFWINLVDPQNKFEQLNDKMQEVYANGGRAVPRVFRYMYIAVKSPEFEQVYRAKTLNNDRDHPLVTYVDYGNEEEVPRDNIFSLEPYLATVLPCQAIRCSLSEVDRLKPEGEMKEELKIKFEELLVEQEIRVKNISPAQKEKPHNEVEILFDSDSKSVLDVLEKELIALSGPPDVPLCTAQVGTVFKGGLVSITSGTDFWVQLAGPIARINDQTKVCTASVTEAPEVGTYCAVVLGEEDDTVYRGRVVSVEGANVTVLCIDYGYTKVLPMKNVYKLKQSCGDLPAQAFHCTLPLEIPAESAEKVVEILKTLSEKCVTVKLYSKQDTRFTVDFQPVDHMTLFTPHACTSTLTPLCEVAGVYSFQTAEPQHTYFVSHTTHLSEFYVQRSDLDIDELATKVGSACSGHLNPIPFPTRGTPCVAKDSTYQAWNRAIVTDICEEGMVKLLFLDYGSSETVKGTTVKEFPESLKTLPVSAIKCALSPLPENYREFTELFTTITADRELCVIPTEDGGVSVTLDGLSLTEVFDKATLYATLKYTQPDIKETCNVYCTSVEDPFNIWVQLAEYEEELQRVMSALAEYCPEAPALYTYSPGTVCAALFPSDETWYRAEITNQGGDKCTVKFVDYGNCCEVDKTALKLIPEEHLTLPANCTLVRLAHVRPQSGTEWDDAAINKLFEITTEQTCEMKCTSVRALQHVTLSVEGADVATSMGEVAKLVPDPDLLTIPELSYQGGETTVFVSYVEQVNQLYGQLDENADAIMALLEITEEGLVAVDQPFKPLQCWAKWSDALYRAILLDHSATHAEVWFADYGNKDKVPLSHLWFLNPEHVELPGQAIPLQLGGVKPVTGSEWTGAAKETLATLINEQSVAVTLPVLSDTSVSSVAVLVDMKLEEVSVAESLKSSKVARSVIQPPVVSAYTSHEFAEEVSVYCSEVKVEEEVVMVTCQLAGEKVNEIQALLQDTITAGHPDYVPEDVAVGLPCTCRFSEDAQWYRAEVTGVEADKATVKFIDYGNSQVSRKCDIQLLPAQFDAPTQIVTVKLANTDKMTDVDKQFLSKIMVIEDEIVMKSCEEDASFVFLKYNEEGEETERTDAVEATLAHSTAVGSYPPFPVLQPEGVLFTCQIDSATEIYVQQAESEEVLEVIGEQMAAHTQKTITTSPFVGQPVLAVFDTALYRAVVLEVLSPSGKCKVRFVDYGNSAVVNEVYDVTPEEVTSPPQAIRCAIDMFVQAPGKSPDQTKTALTTLLQEKEISIVETDSTPKGVSETVTVSLAVEGVNVRLSLLQQGLCADQDESLGTYETVKLPSKPVEVVVTHLENENLFFASRTGGEIVEPDEDDPVPDAELSDDVVDSEKFTVDMQTVLDDDTARPPVLESVQVGTLCITRWEGELYRAVVLWVQHDYVKVRFTDYGNTWYTSLSELLDCPEPYRVPGLAIPLVGQHDTKPVVVETEYLVERVVGEDTTGITVNVSTPKPKLYKYKYTKPELNAQFTGYVSVPLPHGHFFLQTEEGGEVLEATLTPLIATAVAAKVPVPHLVPDAPVLGFFDPAYYRGKVVEVIKEGVAKVLFVDYGNTETCTSMYHVTKELMDVRVVGINCQLDGVNWVGVEAKPTYDEHIVVDAELSVTPLTYDTERKQFTVSVLAGEDVDVKSALLASAVSDKTLSVTLDRGLPTNTYLTFYCSKFNSVQDVCLQVEEDSALLETISSEAESCPKVTLLSAEPGAVCLVRDPSDKLHYRARVCSKDDVTSQYTVHYVDYGNRETLPLSALFDIPATLTHHKICGIQCRIAGSKTPEEGGIDAANTSKLQQMCSPDTALSVSILPRGEEEEEVLSINILLATDTITSHIQEEALEEIPQKFHYPKFEGAQALFISVVNDPTDFYGQREEDGARLQTLTDMVAAKTKTDSLLEDPQPGSICIAKSGDDEQLYRAVVLSTGEEGVTVRYVDYGNTEQVTSSSLYTVPRTLLSLPVLAVPLSLHSISSPDTCWREECLTALSEHLLVDSEVTVTTRTWREEGKCEVDVRLESGACLKSVLVGHVTNTDSEWSPEEALPQDEVEAVATPDSTPHYQYQKLDAAPCTVYVSVANGPDDLYVQKEEWAGELETLQAEIGEKELSVLSSPSPGAICVALSVELGEKYRAEIIAVSEEGVRVRYVDYGNQETVPAANLYSVPDSLVSVPLLAVPCSLPGATWADTAVSSFLTLVPSDSEVVVTPISWSDGDRLICTCKLECNGADIATSISQ